MPKSTDAAMAETITATFGTSSQTQNLLIGPPAYVGGWTFDSASQYTFISNTTLRFYGAGIVTGDDGGSVDIANGGNLGFFNNSTAGNASIRGSNASSQINFWNHSAAGNASISSANKVLFRDQSTAGDATISNRGSSFLTFTSQSSAGSAKIFNDSPFLRFADQSSAGNAEIDNHGKLQFSNNSTAGNAAITNGLFSLNNTPATVDFSGTGGPMGDNKISAGSIAGLGNYNLGANELTVGANNRSTEVGGIISGTGGALVKTGTGALTLSADNTYDRGTRINEGILSISRDANLGATSGGMTFTGGALATTATFDTARAVSLTSQGTFDVTTGTELGLTGIVSSGGRLLKLGGGTLRLTNNDNAYGDTWVANGTLVGNANSISGNIGNAGTVIFDQASNANFTGDIASLPDSPPGVMVKRGAGSLNLAGMSTLDWMVDAGGVITSAERFRGNAAISSGATLIFNQSANAEYPGKLSGTGSVGKAGTGLLDLTGDSSGFTGATTVEGGALAVNGALGGTLNVLYAGRLQGVGTVGSTVISGTVAPGNSIGTLQVAGNITFNRGSAYEVEVSSTGRSDKIVASGTAMLHGGSVKVLAEKGNYAPQTRYTILSAYAQNGRSGTFDGVTSNLAFLDPSLSYDPNNVYLTMTRNDITFQGIGITPNQIATGAGVESLGWGKPVYDAVVNLSAPQARSAFDLLSGEIHASAKTALIEDSRFLRNAVNDRLRATSDDVAASGNVIADASGLPMSVKAGIEGAEVWSRAFGAWGHTDGDGNAASLDRRAGGFFVGADAPAFATWRFGGIAGYSRSSVDVKDRRSSGMIDNYHLGLYGGKRWGELAFRSGAAYTLHDISTDRTALFPGFDNNLKSDYRAGTTQVFGELAYSFQRGATRLEPFANLAYVNLHDGHLRERGGAAALSSPSSNTNTTFSALGLRTSTNFELGRSTVTARGMLGWRHAFGDTVPSSTMRFDGGGHAFSINGVPIAKDVAMIEAGLDYALSASAAFGVAYAGQFGSGMSDQSARVNFNMKF